MGVGYLCNTLAALPPGMRLGTHCIGGSVGPSSSLDRCEKSSPQQFLSSGHPARSKSLYQLSHPGPQSVLKYDIVMAVS
jgi:hypothetical protein